MKVSLKNILFSFMTLIVVGQAITPTVIASAELNSEMFETIATLEDFEENEQGYTLTLDAKEEVGVKFEYDVQNDINNFNFNLNDKVLSLDQSNILTKGENTINIERKSPEDQLSFFNVNIQNKHLDNVNIKTDVFENKTSSYEESEVAFETPESYLVTEGNAKNKDNTVDETTKLKVTKSFVSGSDSVDGNNLATTNEKLKYKIVLDNTASTRDLNDVIVTDVFDELDTDGSIRNLKITDGKNKLDPNDYVYSPDDSTLIIVKIPAGAKYVITYNTKTVAAFSDDSPVENTVTVTSDEIADEISDTASVSKDLAKIHNTKLSKTVVDETNNDAAEGSEELTYTVTLKNKGSAYENNIVLEDKVNDKNLDRSTLEVVSLESSRGTDLSAVKDSDLSDGLQLTIPNLAPKEQVTLTYKVNVVSSVTNSQDAVQNIIKNTTHVTTSYYDGTQAQKLTAKSKINIDNAVEGKIDLKVTKSYVDSSDSIDGNNLATTNEYLSYEIILDNTGSQRDLNDVIVTDVFDELDTDGSISNFKITDGTKELDPNDYAYSPTDPELIIVKIPAGAKYVITYDTKTVAAFSDDSPVDNTVTVTSDEITDQITDTAVVSKDLKKVHNTKLTKSVADKTNNNAAQGSEALTYTITLDNQGSAYETDIVLDDQVSDENLDRATLEVISLESSKGTDLSAVVDNDLSDGLQLTIPNLAPKEQVTLTYKVNVVSSVNNKIKFITKTIDNSVDVTTSYYDGTQAQRLTAKSKINIDIAVEGTIDLKVTKSFVNGSDSFGGNNLATTNEKLSYEIILDNTASQRDLNNVIVTDVFDQIDTDGSISNFKITDGTNELDPNDYSYSSFDPMLIIVKIPAGAKYVITYDTKTVAEFSNDSPVDNTVTVTSNEITEPIIDTASVPKDLERIHNTKLSKTVKDETNNNTAQDSEALTYTITLENQGKVNETNIVLTDQVDDANLDRSTLEVLSLESNKGTDLSTVEDSDLSDGLQLTIPNLAPKEQVTLTYKVNVVGSVTNKIKFTTKTIDNSVEVITSYYNGKTVDELTASAKIIIDNAIEETIALKVSKSFVDGSDSTDGNNLATANEKLSYQVVLDNTESQRDLNDVIVTDVFDKLDTKGTISNFKITDGTNELDPNDYAYNASMGPTLVIVKIPAGAKYVITYDMETVAEFSDESPVDNTVTVTSKEINEAITDTASVAKDLEQIHNTKLSKTVVDETNNNAAQGSEELTYTVTLENQGKVNETNIVLDDQVNDENLDRSTLEVVSLESNKGTDLSAVEDTDFSDGLQLTIPNLAPKEQVTLTYKVNVVSNVINPQEVIQNTINNIVDVTTSYYDGLTASAEINIDNAVEGTIDLKVSKSFVDGSDSIDGNNLATANEKLSYQVVLDNTGSQRDLNDVIVTDVFDELDTKGTISNFKITDGTNELDPNDYAYSSSFGPTLIIVKIPAGAKYVITYDMKTVAEFSDDSPVDNTVTVTSSEINEPITDTVSVPKDLAKIHNTKLSKTVVDETNNNAAQSSEALTYTVTLENQGKVNETNIVLEDQVNDENLDRSTLEVVSLESSKGTDLSAVGDSDLTDGLQLTIPNLAPKEKVTLTYKVNVVSSVNNKIKFITKTIDNRVDMTTSYYDGRNIDGLTASAKINIDNAVEGTIDLKVTKSFVEGSDSIDRNNLATGNEKLSYQVVLDNTGSQRDLNDVLVTDVFDELDTDGIIRNFKITDGTNELDPNDYAYSSSFGPSLIIVKIPAGAKYVITYDIRTVNEFSDDSPVDNAVTVTSSEIKEPITDTVSVPKDLEKIHNTKLSKTVKDETKNNAAQGSEALTYTVSLENQGKVNETNIVLEDQVNDENLDRSTLEVVSLESSKGTDLSAVGDSDLSDGLQLTIPNLAPKEQVTLTYKVNVVSSVVNPQELVQNSINNIVDVTTSYYDGKNIDGLTASAEINIDNAVDGALDLKVTKSFIEGSDSFGGNNLATANEKLSYQVVLDNTESQRDLNDVIVTDVFDELDIDGSISNFKITDGTNELDPNDYSYSSSDPMLIIVKIPAGAKYVITYDMKTVAGFSDDSPVDNSVTVTSREINEPITDTVSVPKDLERIHNTKLTKTVKDETNNNAAQGSEALTYSVTLENNGKVNETNVVLDDQVNDENLDLATLEVMSLESSMGTDLSDVEDSDLSDGLQLTIPNLAPKEQVTLTYKVNVVSSVIKQQEAVQSTINNIVDVTSSYYDGINIDGLTANAEINIDNAVEGTIDLKVSKSFVDGSDSIDGNNLATANEKLSYQVVLDNTGSQRDLNDVIVTDAFDELDTKGTISNFKITDGTNELDPNDYAYSPSFGSTLIIVKIPAGAKYVITYDMETVAEFSDESPVDNTVTVTSKEINEPITDTASVPKDLEQIHNIKLTKTVTDETNNNAAQSSEELTYTVTLENQGKVNETNIVLDDQANDDNLDRSTLEVVSIESNKGTDLSAVGDTDFIDGLQLTIPNLAPKEKVTITYKVKVARSVSNPEEVVQNTINSITYVTTSYYDGINIDGLTVNAEINIDNAVEGTIDLKVSKSFVEGSDSIDRNNLATANEKLSYQVVLDNTGSQRDLNDVIVTDVFDELDTKGTISNFKITDGTNELDPNDYAYSPSFGPTLIIVKIPAGAKYVITYDMKTVAEFSDDSPVDNTVTVTSSEINEPITDTVSVPKDLEQIHNIKLTKTVTDETNNNAAQSSEELTYTVTLENQGKVNETNIVLDDQANDDNLDRSTLEVVSIESNKGTDLSAVGDTDFIDGLQLTIPNLAPKEKVTITYKVKVARSVSNPEEVVQNTINSITYVTTSYYDGINIDGLTANAEINIDNAVEGTIDLKVSKSFVEGSDSIDRNNLATGNEKLSYQVVLDNTGSQRDLNDVLVTDVFDELDTDGIIRNFKITDGTNELDPNDYAYSSPFGPSLIIVKIPAGAKYVITYDIRTVNEFSDDSPVDNTVTVTSSEINEPITDTVSVPKDLAKIHNTKLSKTVVDETNNNAAQSSEALTYTVTLENQGKINETNIVLEDQVNDENLDRSTLEVVSIKSNKGTDLSAVGDSDLTDGLQLTIPNLAPKEKVTLTYKVNVVSSVSNPEEAVQNSIKNIVDVTTSYYDGRNIDGLTANAVINIDNAVDGALDLKVTKSFIEGSDSFGGNNLATTNEKLSYEIVLDNTKSQRDLNDVLVTDVFDDLDGSISNFKITDGTNELDPNDYSYSSSAPMLIIVKIPAGAKYVITYDMKTVNEFSDDSPVDNSVTVTSSEINEAITDTVSVPKDLERIHNTKLSKTVKDETKNNAAQGSEALTYTVTLENQGKVNETNIVLDDRVNDENIDRSTLEVMSLESSMGTDLSAVKDSDLTDGLQLTIPNLAPKEQVTLTYKVNVVSNPQELVQNTINNTVDVTTSYYDGKNIDGLTANAEINIDNAVDGAIDLKVSKSFIEGSDSIDGNNLATGNEKLSYQVILDNTESQRDLNDVIVTDIFDELDTKGTISNFKITDGTNELDPNDYSYSSSDPTLIIVKIPAGAKYVITYDMETVAEFSDDSPVDNTVTVTSKEINEAITDTASVPKDLEQLHNIKLTKTVTDETNNNAAQSSEVLTYTVTLENQGKVNETNIVLDDQANDDNLDRSTLEVVSIESNKGTDLSAVGDSDFIDGLQLTIPNLAPKEKVTITYKVKVARSVSNPEELVQNTINSITYVTTSYYDGINIDGLTVNAEINIDNAVEGAIDLKVSKSFVEGSDSIDRNNLATGNEKLSYQVVLDNTGSQRDLNDVLVTDVFDELDTDGIIRNFKITDGTNELDPNDYAYSSPFGPSLIIVKIPAGAKYVITYDIRTVNEFSDDSPVDNTVTVTSSEINEPITDTVSVPKDLNKIHNTKLSKTVVDETNNNAAQSSEALTYTVTLENQGKINETNIVLEDQVNDENLDRSTLEVVSIKSNKGTDLSAVGDSDLTDGLQLTIPNLAPKEKVTLTYKVNVVSGVSNPEEAVQNSIKNIVDVTTSYYDGRNIDGLTANAVINIDNAVDGALDLKVTKSFIEGSDSFGGNNLATTNEKLSYEIVLDNTKSQRDLNDVLVTDVFDDLDGSISNFKITDGTNELDPNDYSYSSSAPMLIIVKIPAGAKYVITYDMKTVNEFSDDSPVDNSVTVTSSEINEAITDTVSVPKDLERIHNTKLSKTVKDETKNNAAQGSEALTYTVTLENQGKVNETNIVLDDQVNDENLDRSTLKVMSLESSMGTDLSAVKDSDLTDGLQLTIPNLAPKEQVTLTYKVNVVSNPQELVQNTINNTVDVTTSYYDGRNIDGLTANAEINIDNAVDGAIDLKVSKSFIEGSDSIDGNNLATGNEKLSYQVILDNTESQRDLNDVIVTDIFDELDTNGAVSNFKITDGTNELDPNDYSYSSSDPTLIIVKIPAGAKYVITYDMETVSAFSDDSPVDNTVTVTSKEINEAITDTASVPKDLEQLHNIKLTKTVTDETNNNAAQSSEALTYTVTLENQGKVNETNIVLDDQANDDNLDRSTLEVVSIESNKGTDLSAVGDSDFIDGLQLTIPNLAPKEKVTITYKVKVARSVSNPEELVQNTINSITYVTTSYYDGINIDGLTVNAEINIDNAVEGAIDLKVSKSFVEGSDSIDRNNLATGNEKLSYQVVLDNTGSQRDLNDVLVTDVFDELDTDGIIRNFKITDGTNELDPNDYAYSSPFGPSLIIVKIPAGAKYVITYDIRTVNEFSDDSPVDNTVTVTSSEINEPITDTVSVPKDLNKIHNTKLSKTVVDETNNNAAQSSEALTYTVTLENQGKINETNIVLDDQANDDNLDRSTLEVVSIESNKGTDLSAVGDTDFIDGLQLTIPNLAPKEKVTITYKVKVARSVSNPEELVQNTINSITYVTTSYYDGINIDGLTANAEINVDNAVEGKIDLKVSKSFVEGSDSIDGNNLATTNENLSYQVVLDNTGSQRDLNDVIVTDVFDQIDTDGSISNFKITDGTNELDPNDYAFSPSDPMLIIVKIPAGAKYVITYDTKTVAEFSDDSPVDNTVTVTSDEITEVITDTASVSKDLEKIDANKLSKTVVDEKVIEESISDVLDSEEKQSTNTNIIASNTEAVESEVVESEVVESEVVEPTIEAILVKSSEDDNTTVSPSEAGSEAVNVDSK
ncbi:hypothetical protein RZE82_03555 [Mollicutes bacterium LVI A0039]|nr:hypothetical protein RZE82_03555 [Mollicutes bacterium LVI A0039]